MVCTGYGVQPTALQTFIEETQIHCTHNYTSLLNVLKPNRKQNHVNVCGEFNIVSLGHRLVI